jgi:ABC-type antimicrobial peptide transport system permease subunit
MFFLGEPYRQVLAMRVRGPLGMPVASALERIREVDPRIQAEATILEEQLRERLIPRAITVFLLTLASCLSLVITILGIYGAQRLATTSRQREIGIRLALGATPGRIVLPFLLRGLATSGMGVAVGLGCGWALIRIARSQVPGLPRMALGPNLGIGLALLACAAFACLVPALRITAKPALDSIREL